MSNDLKAAASNFSEQAKKLQVALHYTLGDDDKAKRMLSGSYQDILVIKGRFQSSSVYGAILFFFNSNYFKLMSSYALVSKSFELTDVKTGKDWRNFERQLLEIAEKGGFDEIFTAQIKDNIAKRLTIQEITKIVRLIDQDNAIAANHSLQKFLTDATGFQNIELIVDYENISSLSMEIHSQTSTKISPEELQKDPGQSSSAQEIKVEKSDDPLEGRDVKLTLGGALILSPIKGKSISSLVVGDRIMISIVDKNPKAIDVAKAFNAYTEEGKIKPIAGRIVSIKHSDVYHIFVIVAKGIYVKIVEEEDSIKVALDPTYNEAAADASEEDGKSNFMKLLLLSLVLAFLIGLILVFVT